MDYDYRYFMCHTCLFPSVSSTSANLGRNCDSCSRARNKITYGNIYQCKICDFPSMSLGWNRDLLTCDSCYRRTKL